MKVSKLSQLFAAFSTPQPTRVNGEPKQSTTASPQVAAEAAELSPTLNGEDAATRQARVDSIARRVQSGSYFDSVSTTEVAKKVFAELA